MTAEEEYGAAVHRGIVELLVNEQVVPHRPSVTHSKLILFPFLTVWLCLWEVLHILVHIL